MLLDQGILKMAYWFHLEKKIEETSNNVTKTKVIIIQCTRNLINKELKI